MSVVQLFAYIPIFTIILLTKDFYVAGQFGIATQGIQLIYYGKSQANNRYPVAQAAQLMQNIDANQTLVLYIHGYMEGPFSISVQAIVSAYRRRGTDNLVVVDWSMLAAGEYTGVTRATRDVAKAVAQGLQQLVTAGLKPDKIHVVGHSLGGQIAGFIGPNLSFKIPRVTGLDPAFPMFYFPGSTHIDANSALLVDIIHTDGGRLGAQVPTGTVDFFPNGGIRPQPGCPPDFSYLLTPTAVCSHMRSWFYFAESVNNNAAFLAVKCDSYQQFQSGACAKNPPVNMGYAVPNGLSGSYYLTTNSISPFGKGNAGIGK